MSQSRATVCLSTRTVARAAGAEKRVLAVLAVAAVASLVVTIVWGRQMDTMPGMAMPGGWTMSMAWMRMPGQSWASAFASFAGMWAVMMVAMMLPVVAPEWMRYYRAAQTGARSEGGLFPLALGYFTVWSGLGMLLYLPGAALARLEMEHPSVAAVVPIVAGAAILVAGLVQFTPWKRRQLQACRQSLCCSEGGSIKPGGSWRRGVDLGLRCVECCAPMTVVLLSIGVMDLWAMGVVTVAIAAERLIPGRERIAKFLGSVAMVAGAYLLCVPLSFG